MKIYLTENNTLKIDRQEYAKGEYIFEKFESGSFDISHARYGESLINSPKKATEILNENDSFYSSLEELESNIISFFDTTYKAASATPEPVILKSNKLFFGDDIATTTRVSTLAEKWSQGLPLGGFTLTDGSNGYWKIKADENDPAYFDGASEVGLTADVTGTEALIATTDKKNRYLAGHASYFGFTASWDASQANGDFEMLIGAINRGAKSEGRYSEIKDAMFFGLVRVGGVDKWVNRVVKNFTAAPDEEFTPIFNSNHLTIFEQIIGYYGIHPYLLDCVIQEDGKAIERKRVFERRFMSNLTSVSDPNFSLGVIIKNNGNTAPISMSNGSVEFGNYKQVVNEADKDPSARDVSHTISVDTISVDPDYADGSGLLGAFTVPDVVRMVSEVTTTGITLADFTNTIANRLFAIEGKGTANKALFLNIDLLPKDAVTLNGGASYTQINEGRNVLSYALAVDIDTIDFSQRVDATIVRDINVQRTIDLEGVGSDLTSDFVAVVALSSSQATTASDVNVTFITKDLF